MDRFPAPLERDTAEEWAEHAEQVEEFKRNWAFDRKESGLGSSQTSKWICLARGNRMRCPIVGPENVQVAVDLGLPQVTPHPRTPRTHYWGYKDLTRDEADAIDLRHLSQLTAEKSMDRAVEAA